MKIIGIDPGSHRIGYAVLEKQNKNLIFIEKYGVIEIPPNTPSPENLSLLKKELLQIIEECHPQASCIEKLFFHKNLKTATGVLESRGVILLSLYEANIPIVELTITQIKKGITGRGTADKKSIKRSLELILGTSLEGLDDSWDAVAAGFVGLSFIR